MKRIAIILSVAALAFAGCGDPPTEAELSSFEEDARAQIDSSRIELQAAALVAEQSTSDAESFAAMREAADRADSRWREWSVDTDSPGGKADSVHQTISTALRLHREGYEKLAESIDDGSMSASADAGDDFELAASMLDEAESSLDGW